MNTQINTMLIEYTDFKLKVFSEVMCEYGIEVAQYPSSGVKENRCIISSNPLDPRREILIIDGAPVVSVNMAWDAKAGRMSFTSLRLDK